MLPLLQLPVRRKRDALIARQKARYISAILRYDPVEQACIAAGVFAVAAAALEESLPGRMVIGLEDNALHAYMQTRQGDVLSGPPLKLVKALPGPIELAGPDLVWIAAQIKRFDQLDVYEEVRRQNAEMLAVLHELQVANQRATPQETRSTTSAA